jgi:hypothetical protein
MFLSHLRFCYLFFALVPVVLAADVAKRFPGISLSNWTRDNRDPVERFLAQWFRPIAASLAAGLVFLLGITAAGVTAGQAHDIAAKNAISFVKKSAISGHVMNDYNFGGALIFNHIPTFIDGRTDQLFLGGFTLNYQRTMEPGGEIAFEKTLRKYDIVWTMFTPSDPRNTYLALKADWSKAYADDVAVVYVRRGQGNG